MLAKLQSPVVDDAVFRKRLFLALEQARKKRAIWITGLPGSGKTTLVASYISAYKIPHAWYHIDSSDTDIATFFYYLKLLVKGINGKKSTRLPALTPEYLPNISIFAQRYFENLYTMLPKGFVLVFDNQTELFYQWLIILYKSLGRYAEVAVTYKRCAAALSETLGIEPSDKTKELYRSIKP